LYPKRRVGALSGVRADAARRAQVGVDFAWGRPRVPLIIATMLREEGRTGVHTHTRQLRRYLAATSTPVEIITPWSWARLLAVPVFGLRFVVQLFSKSAGVVWYRYWHAVFLTRALRRALARFGDCVVYAQDPLAAQAALRARRGTHQRVVLAVHFRISQADEWADKHQIERDGKVFRSIRALEQEVVPHVDGIVYVSNWAREALWQWLPDAKTVPDEVVNNFVTPHDAPLRLEALADLVTVGHLEPVKNHRYLLQVLASAGRAGRKVSVDIFGEGPLRNDLVNHARALGLEGQVRFRGFRTDLRDFLPGYEAYAHTSYSESSSLAIIESLDAGLPILAAPIGPIAELVDDGVEARFWPLDDADKAALIMLELLDSKSARHKASQAARRRFRREFDAQVVAPRLCAFLFARDPANIDVAGQKILP
jgi:glycosyltransferase involved in cell wall biosynthesis